MFKYITYVGRNEKSAIFGFETFAFEEIFFNSHN